jgi:diguanylate cyclase (GGDEF)-like protein/PAS domain S-box-containing protein
MRQSIAELRELALRSSERRYRRLFEAAQDGILIIDAETAQIEDVNPYLVTMLGYSHREFLGKKLWEVGPFSDIAASKEMFSKLQIEGYVRYEHLPLKSKSGIKIDVQFVSNSYDCDGIKVIQCNIRDITDRVAAEEKTQQLTQVYVALSKSNHAIVHSKTEQELFPKICQIAVQFGGMEMAWIGITCTGSSMVTAVASSGDDARYLKEIKISTDKSNRFGNEPTGTAIRENRPIWCQDFVNNPITIPRHDRAASASLPLHCGGVVVGALSVYSSVANRFDESTRGLLLEMTKNISFALDIFARESLRKLAEDSLLHVAHYDTLTELPNRVLLRDRLVQAIAQAERNKWIVAVLYIDLDRFKLVNDTHGHAAGDKLLQQVSERLSCCLRGGDTIGRLGGDEFAIVLPQISNIEDAALVAQKCMLSFKDPFYLDELETFVSGSIGITLYPVDGELPELLIQNADTAMYRAKELGRNNYQFYTPEMNARARVKLNLADNLRRALERDEMFLHYQPQLDLRTGKIIGAEALIRWNNPALGAVSPCEFIPVAEETGLILSIGEWVLRTACAQNKIWQDSGLPKVIVAVNLSARQMAQSDIVTLVKNVLDETGLESRYLELELTESMVMDEAEDAIETMNRLKELGVHLSIDDFGTGYSNLGYLERFPLNTLKIDRSFINKITDKICTGNDNGVIAKAIINLAHGLGFYVIAEGVETEAQLAFLKTFGCDSMQGFYFSRPIATTDFASLLGAH